MSELQDLTSLIRANTALIVIETPDEGRVVDLFRHLLMSVWRPLFRWSITEGLRRIDLDGEDAPLAPPDATTTLRTIREMDQRGIHLLLDFHPYLGYATTQRMLREMIDRRDCKDHSIVLVGAKIELPPDLEHAAVRFSLRLPNEAALLKLVQDEAALYMREHGGKRVEVDKDALAAIVRNLRGLSLTDARRLARHLIFRDGVIGANDLPELAKLKFELLNRSGNLHFEYDTARFSDVAGLSRLKTWVGQRRSAFTGDVALPVGLDPPKGILLLGVQGCGKSLAAKAVAGGFNVPLVRLDFGTLYNKYHGETEKNLREALASAEQIAPCVLWIDELEKGLASAGGSDDGGVSRRVLGYFLTWMAERKSKVFLVATANAVNDLPPELLRKGRFDEIFFVDLPDHGARAEIFRIHLERREVDWEGFSLDTLAEAANGFSGAEIEQAVVSALYAAHAAQGPVDEARVLTEVRNTRPLSVLMAEQVNALREWARSRTVPAD
ncbi:MAG TPA: AAA family ATPase [Arenimonas sp.]|uniref:AAA family ATPase n=1 Tax=Arenimonas sp. TaxID=1872635 RepID=UPI002D80B63C|nr:AAA family ATPase [Arenimonas sp.]HEU0154013.1 AAA family ATPase [Arenimonas sp.]